jgi:hypothetical protein
MTDSGGSVSVATTIQLSSLSLCSSSMRWGAFVQLRTGTPNTCPRGGCTT